MLRRLGAGALIAASLFIATPAFAQDSVRCGENAESYQPQDVIQSCTALIRSGSYDNANLAIIYSNRGNAYRRAHDLQSALADYTQAIGYDSTDAVSYYNRGVTYGDLHNDRAALADYDSALRYNSGYARAYDARSQTKVNLGDLPGAIADGQRAVALESNNGNFVGNLGYAQVESGDDQAAIETLNRAISLRATGASYNNRGRAYAHMGQADQALQDYAEAARLDPRDPFPRRNRALIYYDRRQYAEAIAELDQAIAIDPNYYQAFITRGNAHDSNDEFNLALADYGRAIAIDATKPDAYAERAIAYYGQRDYTHAFADWDSAAQFDPQSAARQNTRCWNRAVQGLDLAVARLACDRAVQLAQDANSRAEFLDSRGMVGLKQNRNQDAWNDYNTAVTTASADYGNQPSFHYGRGIAALRLGRTAQGEADIAEATRMDADIAQTYERNGVTRP